MTNIPGYTELLIRKKLVTKDHMPYILDEYSNEIEGIVEPYNHYLYIKCKNCNLNIGISFSNNFKHVTINVSINNEKYKPYHYNDVYYYEDYAYKAYIEYLKEVNFPSCKECRDCIIESILE